MRWSKVLYLIVSLFLILWAVIFYFTYKAEKEFQERLDEVGKTMDKKDSKVYQEIEEDINIEETEDAQKKDEKKDIQDDIEDSIEEDIQKQLDVEGVYEDVSESQLQELQSEYSDNIWVNEDFWRLRILEDIYEKQPSKEILVLLVEGFAWVKDYDTALEYLKDLYSQDPELADMDIYLLFEVFLNSMSFSRNNLEQIQSIAESYNQDWYLSDWDKIFFNSLISLVHFEYEDFFEKVEKIEDGKYLDFKDDIRMIKQQYENFKDAEEYYINWLLSFVLYQHWYYKIAKRIAMDVLEENSSYILPNQVLWYSNFLMWNFEEANDFFRSLLDYDSTNFSLYNFFIGISYFWLWEYARAVTFLSQVENHDEILDVKRYLIVSYKNLEQYWNMMDYFQKLLELGKPLTEYDYYTFFDVVFYQPWKKSDSFDLLKSNPRLVVDYISWCYEHMDENKFPCRYARWWFHFARWQYDIWIRYLEHIVEEFPRNYIFEAIGDYYYEKEEFDKARKNYILAIRYSTDSEERKTLRDNIYNIILEQK